VPFADRRRRTHPSVPGKDVEIDDGVDVTCAGFASGERVWPRCYAPCYCFNLFPNKNCASLVGFYFYQILSNLKTFFHKFTINFYHFFIEFDNQI
jgi:hypothetical protein